MSPCLSIERLEERQLLAGLLGDAGSIELETEASTSPTGEEATTSHWDTVCNALLWGIVIGTPIFLGAGIYFGEVVEDYQDVNWGDPYNR